MSRWFRLYAELVDDPKVQRLDGDDFKAEFMRALNKEQSAFEKYCFGPFQRPPANEWAIIRAEVFERDNYACQYCGERGIALECDHVVPVASGGTHNLDNLKTACRSCNRSKAAKSLAEWMA